MMTDEQKERIGEALEHLSDALKGGGINALAIVTSHDTRAKNMDVRMLKRGEDNHLAHHLMELMISNDSLDFDLRNILLTAAAKYCAYNKTAKVAFDRVVEKWESRMEAVQVTENDTLENFE